VLQNVYAALPQLDGIFFLKRGEALDSAEANEQVADMLEMFFENIPLKNQNALRVSPCFAVLTIVQEVRGIHAKSEIYYSQRHTCTEQIEIRIAREQDHDDLAEVFNR